jgi:quinol monooxygenase YgiN
VIHVIAIITAKPGRRAELLERFIGILPLVHAEQGCIEYRPVVDCHAGLEGARSDAGPDSYVVVEKWASLEALDAHAAAPHMVEYNAGAAELIASRVLHVMQDAQAA